MARKVFISFLGTNNYLETYYSLNDFKTSHPVRFVQEALIDFLCKDWEEDDAILIFCTNDAKKKNWVDNGQKNVSSEIEKKGLKGILLNKKLNPQIPDDETMVISEGFSEKEIWKIFETVYKKIEPKDEIYFDVTHAFRSIPLFSTILFNFSRFLKQTKLVSVHYGAFEKLGPAFEVKNIPIENRIAPIIDLTSLIDLQEITSLTNNFVELGKIGNLGNIISNPDTSDTLTQNQKNRISEAIKVLKKNIDLLDSYISTNRMADIRKGKYAKEILDSLNIVLNTDIVTTHP
jgi:CRISPR-associated Csx2 family protein